jgi:hypothetical protein
MVLVIATVLLLLFYVFLDFGHLSWFPPGRTGANRLQLFMLGVNAGFRFPAAF